MAARFRMYPDERQAAVLLSHCRDARTVWNLACEQHEFARRYGRRGKRTSWPSQKEQSAQLTELRASEEWAKAGTTTVQQGALRDFDRALKNHFANPSHFGWPTYRSARHGNQGFIVRDVRLTKLSRKWSEVSIPKLGTVRFRTSTPLPEAYGQGRVTLNRAGQWHVSFSAPQPQLKRQVTGAIIGLDLGIVQSVTGSNGEVWQAPTPRSKARAQRKLARTVKGSNRRERARTEVARIELGNANARKDWVEKTSTSLVREHDIIVFEDLRISNMVKAGKGLARGILAQGWGDLRLRTEQKAATCGVTVIRVPAAYTSQTCNACGHKCKENRENQADFECVRCAHAANADVNAARNILAAGLAVAGRGGLGAVRPPSKRQPRVAA